MKQIYIIRHVDYERLGHIPSILEELNLPYESISLSKNEDLPVLSNVRGIISMGGPMSAYHLEDFSFLEEEMSFLRKITKNEIPFLGICLGGQLLAQAFGAEVKIGEKELGWLQLIETKECEEDPVFGDLEIPLLFQYHYDVFDLPVGAVNLLKSDLWAYQAFRLGKKAYGIQFHPETNVEMLESVFVEYQDKLSPEELEIIREDMENRAEKGREWFKVVLERLFGA